MTTSHNTGIARLTRREAIARVTLAGFAILLCVNGEGDPARVAAEVSEDLRRSLGVRLECEVVAPGSLSKYYDAGRRARRLSRQ